MSIWFFIWLLLSGALIYFMGWNAFILYRQKRAWKSYAGAHKLRYRSPTLFAAPEMNGTAGDYTVSLFTGEHMSPDMRGSRKLTAIEIQLSSRFPLAGGVASGGMVDVIQGMGFKEEINPNHPEWDKAWIARAENRNVLKEYLSAERLAALVSLMKIRNAWVIFIFQDNMMLLRFDTPDPLDSAKKLNYIIKKMTETAKILELKSGESSRLKTYEATKSAKEVTLKVEEENFDGDLSLEEDDQ